MLSGCGEKTEKMEAIIDAVTPLEKGFSDVNGLKMYYEIYGSGEPLVLIHGGGSTINSTFGRVIPEFSTRFKVIAVELQAHGRTSDRDADLNFEQDADDVAQLLRNMKIGKASFFGFSNGATTTLQMAIRHPQLVNRMILGSPLFSRDGVPDGFWEFMKNADLSDMPPELKKSYTDVSENPDGLRNMHDKDAKRMVHFQDISTEKLSAIRIPTLIINADRDVILPEHVIALQHLIKDARLAVFPGVHGAYIGEITTLEKNRKPWKPTVLIVCDFLKP